MLTGLTLEASILKGIKYGSRFDVQKQPGSRTTGRSDLVKPAPELNGSIRVDGSHCFEVESDSVTFGVRKDRFEKPIHVARRESPLKT